MPPQTENDYQKLLTEVIKKQIIILGPDITLAKARNVQGLTIADDGTVMQIVGDPQTITQKLVDQFMELSGLIVKKTMEPLLAGYPGLAQKETQQPSIVPPSGPPPAQTSQTQDKPTENIPGSPDQQASNNQT